MASEEIKEEKKSGIESELDELDKQKLVDSSGRNLTWILCPYCDSKILQPNKAQLVEQEFSLPFVSAKHKEPPASDCEQLHQFWLILDMFTFENVGFSNTVNTTKYLICADCEIGPVGYVNIEDKSKHFIALKRVKHPDLQST